MSAPTAVTAELLRQLPLPRASDDSDKDERGRVLVIAGSPEVPGAALLAGVAALRAGAGKLQIATAASIAPHLGLAVPEALVVALPESPEGGIGPVTARLLVPRLERCDAVLIGPGMLDEEAARDLAAVVLERADGPTFVLDAGALTRLAEITDALRCQSGRMVITPHTGEMAPGIIVGLLARGAKPLEAAIWGVYLHGEAGNHLSHIHGHVGFLARELLDAIPRILADLAPLCQPLR